MGSFTNVSIKNVNAGVSSTTAPTISTVALTSSVGAISNTLNTGDIVYATVTFSQAVEVTGIVGSTPVLILTIGAATVNATYYSGSGTTQLVFAYTILSGQNDVNGISIGANSMAFNGGSIKSLSGVTATITHTAVTDNALYLVDTTNPTVSTVAITGATGVSNSFVNVGDVVTATVTFSKSVTITGSPTLGLNIGGTVVQAAYSSGSGSTSILFTYTIQSGQTDANGISIDANSISLNGGTINDSVGNVATLTHTAVADNASYKVDTTPPSLSTVAITGSAGILNNTLNVGDTVQVTATFTEAVTVTGSPYITITIGSTNVNAGYSSGSGSTALVFSYIILASQTDADGISIAANSLALNSGTITDLAGNTAFISHSAVSDNASYKVDTTAPSIQSVSLTGSTGAIGSVLNTGDTVTASVIFTEAVTVSGGTPYINLNIGGTAVNAFYSSGSGTTTLLFTYTILAGQNDNDGIAIDANQLATNGATITDSAGNTATVTHSAVPANSAYLVDTTAPTVTLTAGTYGPGNSATVTMSELGTVYIVNTSITPSSESMITSSADSSWNSGTISVANTNTSIPLAGLVDGTYRAYGTDSAGNFNTVGSTNTLTVNSSLAVSTYTPLLGATGVSTTTTIQLVFTQNVQRGTGNIELRSGSATGSIIETYAAASSGQIAVSSATVTITPVSALANNTTYYLVFPAGAIQTVGGGVNWAGTSSYYFVTAAAAGAPVGRWVVGASSSVKTSTDGVTWSTTSASPSGFGQLNSVVNANGTLYVTGDGTSFNATTSFAYSHDWGASWNTGTMIQGDRWSGGAFGSGQVMFGGGNYYTYITQQTVANASGSSIYRCVVGFCPYSQYFLITWGGAVYYTPGTPTGVTVAYNASTITTSVSGAGFAFANGVSMLPHGSGILRSTNGGVTWTNITANLGFDNRGVAWVNGTTWISVDYSGIAHTAYRLSTDDGATWTSQTGPNINWWGCVSDNGTGALAFDINGQCYYTTNGTSWTTKGSFANYGSYPIWVDNWAPTTPNPMMVVSRTSSTMTGQVIPSGTLASPDVYFIIQKTSYMGAYMSVKATGQTGLIHDGNSEFGSFFSFNTSGVTATGGFDSATINYADTFLKNGIAGFYLTTYTGNGTTGRAIAHNLGTTPDAFLLVPRSGGGTRYWWFRGVCYESSNQKINYPVAGTRTGTFMTFTTGTIMASTQSILGDYSTTNYTPVANASNIVITGANTNGTNYYIMAFANIPKKCHIGTYTGQGGTNVHVMCGFNSGIRFIMIKAVNTNSGFWVFDDQTGINTGASETPHDWGQTGTTTAVDVITSQTWGFTVGPNNATAPINNSNTEYVYIAYAAVS